MDAFREVSELEPKQVWEGIHARIVAGERLSLAVVELDPGAVVAEHMHEHEQLGLCLRGSMRFRVADETREVAPGDTWSIPSNVPHEATAGPEGAVVIDVFAPVREDWVSLAPAEPSPPRWP
jgi:quercetin dioxygenase-like cupin family protein